MNIHSLINGFSLKTFLNVEKRIRFVASVIIMTLLMLSSTFFFFDKATYFIPIFLIAVYILTYISILQGIEKVEWLMLFMVPVLFTVGFYLFYLLFPVRWLTRLPFLLIYSFSLYALLLTSNIFNVGVEKSLQLYRAAFSVNYFYQTMIIFLFGSVIFSFRLNPLLNAFLMGGLVFLLGLQLLWSVKPKLSIDKQIVTYSLLISLLIVQITAALSFVPIPLTVFALFITASYYSLSGLLYHYLEQKLFTQTIREYIFVIGFVFCIVLLSMPW